MLLTRRQLLASAALAAPGSHLFAARGLRGLKIGVTDWNLRQTGKVEAVELAKRCGFEGVEVSLGRRAEGDKLPLDNPELQGQYLRAFSEHGIRPAGTCLDILHVNFVKNDKLAQKWISDGIRITKQLNARVMLLPMFGKGALATPEEKDYVGDVLRELGPEAEKARILLGLENTISAADNVRIMERSRSKAVLVYYDIGNSTNNGFDIAREIEWLGRKRICQLHFKDNPGYIGEGKVRFRDAVEAISRIQFEGFANLETSSPSKNVEADMKRNLAYTRKVLQEVAQS